MVARVELSPDHVQVVVAGIGRDEILVVAVAAIGHQIDDVRADEAPGDRVDLSDADAGETARSRQIHPEQPSGAIVGVRGIPSAPS